MQPLPVTSLGKMQSQGQLQRLKRKNFMAFILGVIYAGWYFNLGRKEVFVCTNQTRKTQTLLSKILQKLELPDNPDTRKELSYYLIKANMEIKHCPETEFGPAHDYYNIFGKNFSGYGSDDINDGKTIVIELP